MALYRTGTASLSADGVITGQGTKWRDPLTLIRTGATIIFLDDGIKLAVISDIISDTEMRAITTDGATATESKYVILLNDSLTVDGMAQDVAETLRYYQSKETVIEEAIEFFKDFDLQSIKDIVNQVTAILDEAKEISVAIKTSETNANQSAVNAAASETAAEAAKNNSEAIKTEVTQLRDEAQNIVSGGTGAVNAARDAAIVEVNKSRDAALQNVSDASTIAVGEVESAETAGVTAVKGAETAGVNALNAAKDSGLTALNGAVKEINDTKDAALGEVSGAKQEITDTKNAALAEVSGAKEEITNTKDAALAELSGAAKEITDAKEAALTEIGTAQTTGVTAVNNAKDAALTVITNATKEALDARDAAEEAQFAAEEKAAEAGASATSAKASADKVEEIAATIKPELYVVKSENLKDLPSVPDARANLEVYSREEVDALLKGAGGGGGGWVGKVEWHHAAGVPVPGYVHGSGQLINRADVPDLVRAMQAGLVFITDEATWNNDARFRGHYTWGDGVTNIRVPDYNGVVAGSRQAPFLRGWLPGNDGLINDSYVPNLFTVMRQRSGVPSGTTSNTQPAIIDANTPLVRVNWNPNENRGGPAITTAANYTRGYDIVFDASQYHGVYRNGVNDVAPNAINGVWIIKATGKLTTELTAEPSPVSVEEVKTMRDEIAELKAAIAKLSAK